MSASVMKPLTGLWRSRRAGPSVDEPPAKRREGKASNSAAVEKIPTKQKSPVEQIVAAPAATVEGCPDPSWVAEAMGVLRRRLVQGTPGWVPGAMALTDAQLELEGQLTALLTDTVVGSHNNSALLLGPRGTGKTLVLERSLSAVMAAHADLPKMLVVHLSGILHTDDGQALRYAAKQLCQQLKLSWSRTASFEDNMEFLHETLSEAARTHRAVVFALDEFDAFALRPKQTLLYTILNAMHSSQVQAVVLGISCRMDAAELLEKRVLSRFSHRKLIFTGLGEGLNGATRMLRSMLMLPGPAVAEGATADAGKAAYFSEFNRAVTTTLSSTRACAALELPVSLDSSPRGLCQLLSSTLLCMDRDKGVLTPEAVERACAESLRGSHMRALAGCSVLELWLLVAMHRLRAWRSRPAATFAEAWAELAGTGGGGAAAAAAVSYGRACGRRAWAALLLGELLSGTMTGARGGARTRGARAGSQFHQLTLLVPACLLQETLLKHPQVPTALQVWMKQETVGQGAM